MFDRFSEIKSVLEDCMMDDLPDDVREKLGAVLALLFD